MSMVKLHHYGSKGHEFLLNPDLIQTIEAKPDTILHLTNGHELYVKETPDQIVELVREWRRSVLAGVAQRPDSYGDVIA